MPGPVYSQEYVLRKFFGLRPVIDNLVNEIDNIPVLHVKNLPNGVFPFSLDSVQQQGSGSHILGAPVFCHLAGKVKN